MQNVLTMKVMKFGGTSVKDASRIRDVEAIVKKEDLSEGLVLVCSAMKGITDDLIKIARLAESGDKNYEALVKSIWERQETALELLFEDGKRAPVRKQLQVMMKEIEEIAHGIFLIRECSLRSQDLLMGFGERLNNSLIAAYFSTRGFDAVYVDARNLIVTDQNYGAAVVDFEVTNEKIRLGFEKLWDADRKNKIAVVTGFVAATPEGISTTLGRNGSDYTAAIFGAALNAKDIEIWTDVDGVLSADPRVVPKAFVIPELSVDEAMEMCYFGAEVLHPSTIIPAVEKSIPIWIKNTLNPSAPGTKIAVNVPRSSNVVTGIASMQKVGIINILGGGLIGAKGVAARIFSSLAKADVNIIMISQASSELSICLVLKQDECERALASLSLSLEDLLASRQISKIELVKSVEIVSVIGANMRGKPGVSGKIFDALGKNGINVLVIAQGSSEMNVSFVIEQKDHLQALNVLHEAFFPEVDA